MPAASGAPDELIGQEVVLDTAGQFVYLGILKRAGDNFLELDDADVHDSSQSPTSKEVYVIDARKYGIHKNRKNVFVRAALVVSISRLGDVIEY
jgi:hypothetical protein